MAMTNEDGERSGQVWRHVRTAVVLLCLLGLVGWAGWTGYQAFTEPPSGSSEVVCTPRDPNAGATVNPRRVRVRVYNATLTAGLASAVAEDLSEQGFQVVEIANDPQQRSIAENALIVSSGQVKDRVRTLRAYVPGARRARDARESRVLDLVLGESFDGLTIPPPRCPREDGPTGQEA
jgi:hypothetical protein